MPDYPGLGLPLRHHVQDGSTQQYPLGAHHYCNGSDSEMLFVREVAMMIIMDQLTDKPLWHNKVFDEAIVGKWRQEAMEYPDESLWVQATGQLLPDGEAEEGEQDPLDSMNPLTGIMCEEAFDYCIKELRNKAKYFKTSGIIPTLDATFSIAKSDTLVPSELHERLRHAIETLKADQGDTPDWHPGSNEMVQDLVHPSMYPLVYGESLVLKDEVVGVTDAVDKWAGKGEVIPKPRVQTSSTPDLDKFWSDTYQWLPANMAFQEDGSVRFTSYINNLHPEHYPEVYSSIEAFVSSVALPMWDQCLQLTTGEYEVKREGAGRTTSRFAVPENPDDDHVENWAPEDRADVRGDDCDDVAQEVAGQVEGAERNVSNGEDHPVGEDALGGQGNDGGDSEGSDDLGFDEEEDENSEDYVTTSDGEEDGSGIGTGDDWDDDSYHTIDWSTKTPIQRLPDPFKDVDYGLKSRLVERFKESGLQVIVKMVSIELTPEKPEFPAGGWHVEGQMNERICATALYYIDSENITDSNLSFRVRTATEEWETMYTVGQDAYHWLERVYGVRLSAGDGDPCLQRHGSVQTPQGRVLAFANVFQHKVSSFKLRDPTKPGHRRFLALWLVDPHTRIISTANVPPQQRQWWLNSILGPTPESKERSWSKLPPEIVRLMKEQGVLPSLAGDNRSEDQEREGDEGPDEAGRTEEQGDRLPPELMEKIRADFKVGLMSAKEAREHRVKLMQVRTAFQDEARKEWNNVTYSFCEH